MQNQKLCLKWNNHMPNMLSLLESFQQQDILVDVTISCEGQNTKAHKVVLSACSPYFQKIFMENPCQHPIIIITGMKYEDIIAILNFMYKGEVNVSHDGLSSFLQAAEALKVKGLAEVCGEKKGTNSISQEIQQSESNRPQRTDTPPRKRPRNRKRSLSDSNRSDDEGLSRKIREPSSPEVHELSGDESFTGDNSSNGPPFNSVSRVPQNVYSRSHQSSSNMGGEDDDEYDVESTKMLDTTDSTVSMNNTNADNNLRIERIMGNATEIESSSLADPESPPDIKPIINFGEASAGPSESGNMMLYNEQSQPGPSNVQDSSLLHDNSHAQGFRQTVLTILKKIVVEQKRIKNIVQTNALKTPPSDCPPLPCTSPDGIIFFNNFLDNETNFQNLISHFQTFGGATSDHAIRRLLGSIIDKELSIQYNWKGSRGEKLPFHIYTNIIKLISGSIRSQKAFESVTDHDIESCIKKWLMHAKDRSEFEENTVTMLRDIISEQKSLGSRLDELLPSVNAKTIPEDCPQFPIDTAETLLDFDKYLQNTDNFKKVCAFFKSIGGADANHTVRRICHAIMTNKLSLNYNWKGQGEKEPFSQFRYIINMISESVRKNPICLTTTDHEIENSIKKWLVYAKDRDGGRQNRGKNS